MMFSDSILTPETLNIFHEFTEGYGDIRNRTHPPLFLRLGCISIFQFLRSSEAPIGPSYFINDLTTTESSGE